MKNSIIKNDEGKAIGIELVSDRGVRVVLKDGADIGTAHISIDPPGEMTAVELLQLSVMLAMVAKMQHMKATAAAGALEAAITA